MNYFDEQRKLYEPSENLHKKIQEFIDKVIELDSNAHIGVIKADNDVVVQVRSNKHRQVTQYAVWEINGVVDGSLIGGMRI